MPPVQLSIAPEGYLEIVKAQLAEIIVTKPRNNLSRNEVTAPKELKNNSALHLKRQTKVQQQSSQIRQKKNRRG